MARSSDQKRRPRVRKTAPTVRERVQAAQAEQQSPKTGRVRKAAGKASAPFKRLSLSDRPALRVIAKPFRVLKKALKWLVPRYLVNSWRELRQVYWPNRRETWRLTAAVFVFAIVFGALVAGVDKGLDEIFKKVVLK